MGGGVCAESNPAPAPANTAASDQTSMIAKIFAAKKRDTYRSQTEILFNDARNSATANSVATHTSLWLSRTVLCWLTSYNKREPCRKVAFCRWRLHHPMIAIRGRNSSPASVSRDKSA